jgi:hypothetical protein
MCVAGYCWPWCMFASTPYPPPLLPMLSKTSRELCEYDNLSYLRGVLTEILEPKTSRKLILVHVDPPFSPCTLLLPPPLVMS